MMGAFPAPRSRFWWYGYLTSLFGGATAAKVAEFAGWPNALLASWLCLAAFVLPFCVYASTRQRRAQKARDVQIARAALAQLQANQSRR